MSAEFPQGEHTRNLTGHVPVLFEEAIEFLAVRPGGTYVDCTLGLAGHAEGVVRRLGPAGHLIGFDRDVTALELAKARLDRVCGELGSEAPKVTLVDEAFSSIANHVEAGTVDGVLADFGVSSMQFDQGGRGFSFQKDGPLDMRMDTRTGPTAAELVHDLRERELADILYLYGEERRSWRIARAIAGRWFTSTLEFARIVAQAAPAVKGERIHAATKTFQALRIYLNSELDEIRALLEAAPKLLKPSARLVVISFHSLEDRIVKDSVRAGAQQGIWKVLTKKPVTASEEETERNPRSRSAKLRAAEKVKTGNREQGIGTKGPRRRDRD